MSESQPHSPAVLIADDDSVIRLLMAEALTTAGFSVTAVENGSEAVSAFQSLRPDLVVLDVQMPGLDGFGACREIRSSEGGLRIPIVMATGLEDIDAIERAYAVGATDFITKPINWVILTQRLRYMMRAADSVEAWMGSERENQALLDAIPDSILKLDRDGNILHVRTPEGEPPRILEGDPTGQKVTEAMPPDIGHLCLHHLKDALEHGRSEFECRLTEDGRNGDFEVRLVAAGEEVLAIVRDVTDQKRVAAETLRSQKLEALGRLAGSVAHDFNNVLTVISGFARLIAMSPGKKQTVKHNVDRIIQASEHAAVLTRQLTAFNKEEASDPQILDLNVLISNLENVLRRILGEEIEFSSKLESGLPQVKVDKGRFEQVLINLGMNSRDAMARGGRFSIETETVPDGSGNGDPRRVVVSVSDTGQGMPEEVARRVFEPFFTTRKEGPGLGLSTSEKIVRESGGEMTVESQVEAGTTFKIVLPGAGDLPSDGQPSDASSELPRGSETVLIVDCDDMVREVTSRTLEGLGYTVLSAPSAIVALEMSRVREGIDILLTDVVMPGLSGPDLVAELAIEKPSIRVLYVSGNTGDSLVRYGVVSRDVNLLRKPFTPDQLAHRVRQTLDELSKVPEDVGAGVSDGD